MQVRDDAGRYERVQFELGRVMRDVAQLGKGIQGFKRLPKDMRKM